MLRVCDFAHPFQVKYAVPALASLVFGQPSQLHKVATPNLTNIDKGG